MRKLISFMHVSLDGFVADKNGDHRWVHVDEEIFEYSGRLTQECDTGLYGRVTYDLMESYWPTAVDQPDASKHDIEHSAWYMAVPKVVLSRSMKQDDNKNVRVINENLADEINKIKSQAGKNIVIFGSPGASHSLMKLGLIDEFWLFVNPVLLGEGTPMFKGISEKTKLCLLETKVFSSGVVGLHYSL